VLVEIGTDMTRFGSSRRLASWAGMCPGNYESAGARHGGRTRRGSPWLRSALVGSARSASRTDTYLGAQYHRLAARRGAMRACVALGHRILGIIYAVLTTDQPFHDIGLRHFDDRDRERARRRLTRRLEQLGYAVTLRPEAA
jgi:transposase